MSREIKAVIRHRMAHSFIAETPDGKFWLCDNSGTIIGQAIYWREP